MLFSGSMDVSISRNIRKGQELNGRVQRAQGREQQRTEHRAQGTGQNNITDQPPASRS